MKASFSPRGKTLSFRRAEEPDAEFTLNLRLDPRLRDFFSPMEPDVEKQKEYIRAFHRQEAEGKGYFFIVEREGVPCGMVRLSGITGDSFTWGNWILAGSRSRFAALECALMVYRFAFEDLHLSFAHFDVIKANRRIARFHAKLGASVTGEDEKRFYFKFTREDYKKARDKFRRVLP